MRIQEWGRSKAGNKLWGPAPVGPCTPKLHGTSTEAAVPSCGRSTVPVACSNPRDMVFEEGPG